MAVVCFMAALQRIGIQAGGCYYNLIQRQLTTDGRAPDPDEEGGLSLG
jgi:hypothetical protein